ncbi:hypothetical protein [Alicyclobacillus mengziensis]|uniref:DUF3311 domain-containing protein n=1 Tax=Alicyclobacillus mengziensis TaxID=2931921 RepID=A0A9X7Z5V7_9BACL|nr:hypothetical protein [Alicyclobacillus mengziensis]QSO45558.1 hypothetical protein JZ786_13350 [Alicyclobacillus mengziensis]
MKLTWMLYVPFITIFVLTFLPAINGPHLWIGLPSLLVWILGWTLMITVILLLYHHYSLKKPEEEGDDA